MSPGEYEDALDTIDRADPESSIYSPEECRTLMKLLWAYERSSDVNEFAEALRLPVTDAMERLYTTTHHAFIAAWNRYGGQQVWMMARSGWDYLYADDWRLV